MYTFSINLSINVPPVKNITHKFNLSCINRTLFSNTRRFSWECQKRQSFYKMAFQPRSLLVVSSYAQFVNDNIPAWSLYGTTWIWFTTRLNDPDIHARSQAVVKHIRTKLGSYIILEWSITKIQPDLGALYVAENLKPTPTWSSTLPRTRPRNLTSVQVVGQDSYKSVA